LSITLLCACVLNWSSFVFENIISSDSEAYSKDPTHYMKIKSRNNLHTGMLAINGSMLIGIVLAVVHCGAPTRYGAGERRRRRQNQSHRRRVMLSQALREQQERDLLNYSELRMDEQPYQNLRAHAPFAANNNDSENENRNEHGQVTAIISPSSPLPQEIKRRR